MEEATRKRIIAQLADRAVIERLVESHIPEAWIGLDALAKDLGVPTDCIALGSSLAELSTSGGDSSPALIALGAASALVLVQRLATAPERVK